MSFVDFILNLAAVLLWASWRSVPLDPVQQAAPATLMGTLKRAEPRRVQRWSLLASLAALLLARAVFYWQIGEAVSWNPSLRLGAIVIVFRSDLFMRMLLFSALSFLEAVGILYLWLLLLSVANGRGTEGGPFQRLVRWHLGPVDRLPWPLKAILPWLAAGLFWLALHPLLVRMNIVPPAESSAHRIQQAAVIGLAAYLPAKYLIGVVLGLALVASYVYFGRHPFWAFISVTGRNLIKPLSPVPLRFGKVDFAPVVGLALVFFTAEWAERGLTMIYPRT